MIKIVATSDNHGYLDSIQEILNKNSNADFYLHMGDCCCNPMDIRPFVAVKGNNDYNLDLPEHKVIEINKDNRIFMVHGHQYTFNIARMVEEAKKERCNIILCGHTHTFADYVKEGVRIINPGSCTYNRDYSNPCYAVITIDDNNSIKVDKVELERLF